MVCKRAFVSGFVQGVAFRYFTMLEAKSLKISGYARNLWDGRVEVVAKGDAESVDQLMAWLHQGSPMAKVSGVVIESDFEWNGRGFTTH
ncbi:MAG: Acylphosphatase [Candidatus Celerinatantimonas neptuna]|nr:MAG: Acylphosphatase [Candidatus Celerinatantimonas neptuna]